MELSTRSILTTCSLHVFLYIFDKSCDKKNIANPLMRQNKLIKRAHEHGIYALHLLIVAY